MKKKHERRLLAYDDFRRFVESGEWLDEAGIPRELAKAQIAQASAAIRASKVYLLSAEVCKTLVDLVNKAGAVPVPFAEFPVIPMWIEFEIFIGDASVTAPLAAEESGTAIAAIWIAPSPPDHSGQIVADLFTPGFRKKSLAFAGSLWSYVQRGACPLAICPRASMTREGEDYSVASSEVAGLATIGCECARAAQVWSNFLALAVHMLRAPRPVTIKEISRDQPLPRDAFRRRQAEEENRRYPRYVHVSLSEPIEIAASPPTAAKSSGTPREQSGGEAPRRSVTGYWKFLVPGEGKPWKTLQTIHVDAYHRRQRIAEQPTRYIIKP